MKNAIFFYIVLFLGGFLLNAQTRTLPELLSELDKNHIGTISGVFNADEIQLLQNHFDVINEPINNRGGGFEIFAPENVNGYFGHFNSGAPDNFMKTSMSTTADFEGAGVINSETGKGFVVDDAGNAYEVNTETGIYIFLGTVATPNGESITGLDVDTTTGDIYALSTDGEGGSTIFKIDPVTLVISEEQPVSSTLPICLGIDLFGNGYFLDIDSDNMFKINLFTGAIELLGPAGFNANFAQGMGVGEDGEMYLSAFNDTAFRSELRVVNTETGATTLVGPIGSSSPGGTTQYGWMSVNTQLLSVGENVSNGFTLYPNPASSTLNIQTNFGISSYQIYDVTGALLMSKEYNGSIDVSSLTVGAYFISVESASGEFSTQKFLKE